MLDRDDAVVAGDAVPQPIEMTSLVSAFYREPRCRVCRSDVVRPRVNDLLARGSSYAGVLRVIDDVNAGLDAPDRVTIDSIRSHATRHFPVQNAARATYREILERQAGENGVDFVNGVMTAITPMALLETVVARGYETIVDPETTVDVKTATYAALQLQGLLDSRAGHADAAQMMAQMSQVVDAVHTFVPRDQWPALQAALRGESGAIENELAQQVRPNVRIVSIDDGPDEADERRHA